MLCRAGVRPERIEQPSQTFCLPWYREQLEEKRNLVEVLAVLVLRMGGTVEIESREFVIKHEIAIVRDDETLNWKIRARIK